MTTITSTDLRNKSIGLYTPPFRFEHGYIWDAKGQMVADNHVDGEDAALRVRGWGRISYMENPEALQDEVGNVIALAMTEFWERRKAERDSEPVAWTWQYREQWHVTSDPRRAEFVAKDGDVVVLPLYRHAQPAPVVLDARAAFNAWNNDVDCPLAGRDAKSAAWMAWNYRAMLQAGNSPVIPDGYVMVPKEPTKEILDEFDSIIDYGAEDSVDAWRRLLAAAPQEVKGE